ncbi:DRMBL-domain-containing protein [Hypoxylon sp. FL1284]|nr:DRMBL-domain-containing protein [Hypoxylon sp. FL1284]
MAPSKTAKALTPRRQSKLNFGSATGGKNANAKTPIGKKSANGNILNFFQKVEVEEQLFCADPSTLPAPSTASTITHTPAPIPSAKSKSSEDEDDLFGDEYIAEEPRSPKRRKLSHDGTKDLPLQSKDRDEPKTSNSTVLEQTTRAQAKKKKKGPFVDDSDSEDDDIQSSPLGHGVDSEVKDAPPAENGIEEPETAFVPALPADESCPDISHIPPLKQGDLTYEEFKSLEDVEELFDDVDEFDDGEEYRERRYMEEQARLEAQEAGNYTADGLAEPQDGGGIVESCPLCNASLAGLSADQATVHVNGCLDGSSIPPAKPENPPPAETINAPEVSKRFARAAIPRPGQSNPISLGNATSKPTSAFSRLMSGHAEDAAWASAAASENASRGKPAYQRTCPFYKSMPGFSICVDAFRYGAVKGCNAYFLSHFHSDHYIGLTANWSHGPIYCSKVTGSLVKSQLRTAAKWVKELEFEETVEIPGTEGATVTMIPANHCPGSSLFLFEKNIGRGPKKQRILHCGDFRACPAQVAHPLLKPETMDAVSGKAKQQRIDVCYLDTTYLNPRYSFPPQDDVITACAEFCKSISGDDVSAEEFLSAAKQEKGTVSNFFRKEGKQADAAGSKPEGGANKEKKKKDRLLVICGTYSIGKERICKAIAQALGTKIFASAAKIRMCSQLGDPELAALMTSDPLEAQVHMQMLMEIRADTLRDYLDGYRPHFTRVVGFRPSGWSYRPPASNAKAAGGAVAANASPSTIPTTALLHGPAWRTRFSRADLAAQRGSARDAMCFGVPYSEHSSFRELALFLMALRVDKVVPTVNVGSEPARRRMKAWTDRWLAERARGGLVRVLEGEEEKWEEGVDKGKGKGEVVLWDGKDGKGGGVWW